MRQPRTKFQMPPEVTNERVELVEVGKLKPYPNNPRRGDIEAIRESLRSVGFIGAIVAQLSTGYVLAGNHTLEAARLEGMHAVPVAWVDLTDAEAAAFVLAANRIPELAGYDDPTLAALMAEVSDTHGLAGTGWSDDDFQDLIGKLAEAPDLISAGGNDPTDQGGGGKTDDQPEERDEKEDEAPAADQVTRRVKLGDVWRLGRHRLLCGDSTDPDAVARLFAGETCDVILTDPPYCSGGFQEAGRTVTSTEAVKRADAPKIANDNLTTEGLQALIEGAIRRAPCTGCLYLFHDWRQVFAIRRAVEPLGYQFRALLVWDKKSAGLGGPWRHQYELVYFGTRRKEPPTGKYGDVLSVSRDTSKLHPTVKPLELLEKIIENTQGTRFYDPFGGSGSTLIACDRLGKIAYIAELDPGFCNVILTRWENATGQTAERESGPE